MLKGATAIRALPSAEAVTAIHLPMGALLTLQVVPESLDV
jgi:hypothetical protein